MQKLLLKLSDRMSIEIEAETSQDVIRTAAFWQSIPTQCAVCQATLVFDYQTPQTYKYYKLKCTGPTPHTVNLSERTDHSGMYFDNRKTWDTWRAGQTEEQARDILTPPATLASPHPNAPDGERGRLINNVKRLFDDCRDRNVDGYGKVKLELLGKFSDQQLKAAADYLQGLLNNPPPKPKPADDDIPF